MPVFVDHRFTDLQRLTTAERDALTGMTGGRSIFNVTVSEAQLYDGAAWQTLYRSGGTDVAIADGGTGASTALSARTNLGIGTGDSPTLTGLTLSGLTANHVITAGVGGVLSGSSSLTWAGDQLTIGATGSTRTVTSPNGIDNVVSAEGSPRIRLHRDIISGAGSSSGLQLSIDGSVDPVTNGVAVAITAASRLGLYTSNGTALVERASIDGSGNVNIVGLTATRLMATDGSKNLASTSLSSWLAGTANQVTVTDDGDGTATLSLTNPIAFSGFRVLYLPDQTSFSGSLAFGDGLENLAHTASDEGWDNIAIGLDAGKNLTTGKANVLIGTDAGRDMTSVSVLTTYSGAPGNSGNTFVGRSIGAVANGATDNVFIGVNSGQNLTDGMDNVAAGANALRMIEGGSENAAYGHGALENIVGSGIFATGTGHRLTGLGDQAGRFLNDLTNKTGGKTSVYVGANTTSASNTAVNENVFGYAATGAGDNTVTLGNDSIVTTLLKGLVGINKSASLGGQLHVVAKDATTPGLRVDSAATPSVDVVQFYAGGAKRVWVNSSGNLQALSTISVGVDGDVSGGFIDDDAISNSLLIQSDPGGTGANSYTRFTVDGTEVARFDVNATAGNSRFLLYDVDSGTVKRVSFGAADSGGSGFKVLRAAN